MKVSNRMIRFGLTLVFLFSICFGQNVFYLQKGDSNIVVKTGESRYFYNSIREVCDSSINETVGSNHEIVLDIIVVSSSFNDELKGWDVEWRLKRDSFLLQQGFFNIMGRADGEFNCFWVMDSSRCVYKSGIKEGTEFFYRSNNLHVRCYKNGLLNGMYYVIENERFLSHISEYKKGKKHGIDHDFWVSNNEVSLHYSDIYVDGVIKDGKSYVYHPDGSIFAETNHKNGRLHGICKIYGARGTLIRFEKYKNGKLVKTYKVD